MRTYNITIQYRLRVKAGNPELALEKIEEKFPELDVPENIDGVTFLRANLDIEMAEDGD